MNIDQRLAVIKQKIEQLKLQDENFEIFGADTHQYQFNSPLTEQELTVFEKQHRLQLPVDYRLFITTIGNGGMGPYYGLIPLEEAILVSDNTDNFAVNSQDIENYLTQSEIAINEGEEDLIEKIALPDPLTGLLCLADYGCGCYLGFAISGEQTGTIWFVETDFKTITPQFTKAGKQQTFLDWYEQWLDNELQLNINATKSPWNEHSKSITLNGHQLTKMPQEIAQCIDLRTLNLGTNRLEYFPEEILKLKELRTLDLSMNPMINISHDIGNLTKLKRLFLNNNELESLPLSLANTQLRELTCTSSNQITKLPAVINQLSHLEILNFSYSDRLTDITEIQPLSNLKSLNISNCKEIKSLPDSISKCKNLEELFIGETAIQQLPDSFSQLKSLTKLDLNIYDMNLEAAFEKIKLLPKLSYLILSNQLIYPENTKYLTNIKHLVIKQNYSLWHKGHKNFPLDKNISLFTNLETLKFDNDGQINQLPENIGELKNLKEIILPAVSYFPDSMKNLQTVQYIRGRASATPKEEINKLKSWYPQAKVVFF